jgi:hypothetical protein
MTTTRTPDGWYYRRDGQPVGPVSAEELRGLLAAGALQPGQAVWRCEPARTLFVPALAVTRAEGRVRAGAAS